MRTRTPLIPVGTKYRMGRFRNSKAAIKTQDLTAGMAAFGLVDDAVGLDADAVAELPVTQTQSPTESFKPSQLSKTCPSPATPYSFVTSPLLLLDPLNSAGQIRAILIFHLRIVNLSSTGRRISTNWGALAYRVALLVWWTSQNRELDKRSRSPPPPHRPQKRNARKDEESVAQTKPTHA